MPLKAINRASRILCAEPMSFLLSLEQTPCASRLDGLERARDVAALADRPEAAVVDVLLRVAVRAGAGEF
jgi:hypothetical protein